MDYMWDDGAQTHNSTENLNTTFCPLYSARCKHYISRNALQQSIDTEPSGSCIKFLAAEA